MMTGAMKAAWLLKAMASPHQASEATVRPRIIAVRARMQDPAHSASHWPSKAALMTAVGSTSVKTDSRGDAPIALRRSAAAHVRNRLPATDKALIIAIGASQPCANDAAAIR